MVFGTHSICGVSFCDVHLRGGGGAASELCGARNGEPRSVNATRRDRNDMLLWRDGQYPIGQVRKGAK